MWKFLASLYNKLSFLPIKRETIVLPYDLDDVSYKLWMATKPVETEVEIPEVAETSFLFNGWIKDRKFRISRIIRYYNNFIPLISGIIEPTSTGSIIFLKYKLFPFTNFFLIFWTSLAAFMSLFFLLYTRNDLYAFLATLAGLFNYLVAIINFNIQIGKSRNLLRDLFR